MCNCIDMTTTICVDMQPKPRPDGSQSGFNDSLPEVSPAASHSSLPLLGARPKGDDKTRQIATNCDNRLARKAVERETLRPPWPLLMHRTDRTARFHFPVIFGHVWSSLVISGKPTRPAPGTSPLRSTAYSLQPPARPIPSRPTLPEGAFTRQRDIAMMRRVIK
jgi:hypothetical protein